jgi:hypothetical protein
VAKDHAHQIFERGRTRPVLRKHTRLRGVGWSPLLDHSRQLSGCAVPIGLDVLLSSTILFFFFFCERLALIIELLDTGKKLYFLEVQDSHICSQGSK